MNRNNNFDVFVANLMMIVLVMVTFLISTTAFQQQQQQIIIIPQLGSIQQITNNHDYHRYRSIDTAARTLSPARTLGPTDRRRRSSTVTVLYADWNDGNAQNSNAWNSIDDDFEKQEGWREEMEARDDGTMWKSTEEEENENEEESDQDTKTTTSKSSSSSFDPDDDNSEAWLDTLASIAAEEIDFNLREAERADKARQMEEWGFDKSTIASTLDVAVDLSEEVDDEVEANMQSYREDTWYEDEIDMEMVESHTLVEMDAETKEPVRAQMVYVDEHTCIGCKNCANVAQSTFFMEQEHGRARVFQQWVDEDETIQIAIETCPVDCIHYIPYEELVSLEVGRRGQNINNKARLVSQAEYSGAGRVGSAVAYTAPQIISGNSAMRCNNCPSRGCKDCPMFGVGQNPEFERKEEERKLQKAKREMVNQRQMAGESIDL